MESLYLSYTVAKSYNTWSRINGRLTSGNPFPNQAGLNGRPGGPPPRTNAATRAMLEIMVDRGVIRDMSQSPALSVLQEFYRDESLSTGIRQAAAAAAVAYEIRKKGIEPHQPEIPDGYSLPSLETVASCHRALKQIVEDTLQRKLKPDAAKELREHVETIRNALEPTEIREKLAEFAAVVEQIEAAKSPTIDHDPLPPSD